MYAAADVAGKFGMSTLIATIVSTLIAHVLFGTTTDEMWVIVNTVQIIFLSLALKVFHTIHVQVMLSFLSFVNTENSYLAQLFLFPLDQNKLSEEPLDH